MMGTGFSKRKKEARAMQQQLSQMQAKMAQSEVTGKAGNGLVTVLLNGHGDLKQIKIKPECVDPEDVEGLEDLIKAAFSAATDQLHRQAERLAPEESAGSTLNFDPTGVL